MATPLEDFNSASSVTPDIVRDFLGCISSHDLTGFCGHLNRYGLQVAEGSYTPPFGEEMFPLMQAAAYGRGQMVIVLLEQGVAIDRGEKTHGTTALQFAAAFGHPDVMKLLIDRGADVKIQGRNGEFPLLSAIRGGVQNPGVELETTALLLAHGADINQRTPTGVTAAMKAAAHGQTELCLFLFNRSADFSLRDEEGFTALDHARNSGRGETAQAIEEALNARDAAICENEWRDISANTSLKKPIATRGPLRFSGRGTQ
jgi:uncharacterized protein